MRKTTLVRLLFAAALLPAAANAQSSDSFHSPSGNIHCTYFSGDGPASLRCDIGKITNRLPPRPRDCDLDWGRAFEVLVNAQQAARICVGDTVADTGTPVLAYGQTWQRGGFTCHSAPAGITCRNARGAGFELSRAAQRLF